MTLLRIILIMVFTLPAPTAYAANSKPAASAPAAVISATEDGVLGLYSARDMRITDGNCVDCATIPQALWYFKQESIAVANSGQPIAAYSAQDDASTDIKNWAVSASNNELHALPPLIWIGSSQVIPNASLSADGRELMLADGSKMSFAITPKIASNLSYYDGSSLQFFRQRALRLRGETTLDADGKQHFIARTIWPRDYTITNTPVQPLGKPDSQLSAGQSGSQQSENLQSLVRANNGGAQSSFQSRVLWSRTPGIQQNWTGKAVLGVMLNGAQGDDDEAHGGHFGMVTGQFNANGDWSRWLVNNFYNLDSYSEKGIIAAVTPADNYLMDLNSGQSYYRPSYMLVAVLKNPAVPQQYQAAINRVYNHFYRHDFVYNHAAANCAGISIDALRNVGWQVPERGNGGLAKATAAYVYVAATSQSLHDARNIYSYITTEDTRLNPAAAFDAIGNDMLQLAQHQAKRPLSKIEQQFSDDIEAIVYVHIPQIPSSRVFGQAPVYSFDEYLKRAPADRSQWKIVPVEPRPFPSELRNGLALAQKQTMLVPWPVTTAALVLLISLGWLLRKIYRLRNK